MGIRSRVGNYVAGTSTVPNAALEMCYLLLVQLTDLFFNYFVCLPFLLIRQVPPRGYFCNFMLQCLESENESTEIASKQNN